MIITKLCNSYLYTFNTSTPYTITKPTSRNQGTNKQVVDVGSKYWITTWKRQCLFLPFIHSTSTVRKTFLQPDSNVCLCESPNKNLIYFCSYNSRSSQITYTACYKWIFFINWKEQTSLLPPFQSVFLPKSQINCASGFQTQIWCSFSKNYLKLIWTWAWL